MVKQYLFLSGLPRSGSTLLCNILMQNPDIYASATSGLVDVMLPIKNGWNHIPAMLAMPSAESYKRLEDTLRGVLTGYYASIDKPVIIDKSRAWPKFVPMLEKVLDQPVKIVVTVRRLVEILSSLEKLYRKTGSLGQIGQEKINPDSFTSIEKRCKFWVQGNQLLGSSVNILKDAFACGWDDRFHVIDYKDLTKAPKATLEALYNFLELEPFEHDFDHVSQMTFEDDRIHSFYGLHDIREKVEYQQPDFKQILGVDLVKSLDGQEFW